MPGKSGSKEQLREHNRLVDWGVTFDRKGHPDTLDHDMIAQRITERERFVYISSLDALYIYREGVYRTEGLDGLKKELINFLGPLQKEDGSDLIKTGDIEEIIRRVKLRASEPHTIFSQDKNRPLFAVANGILDLNTYKLIEFAPDIYLQSKSPTEYNPDAKCDFWLEYLDTILPKEYQKLLQEMFGACLWPGYEFQKAFMLYGGKRTGKGTTTRTLEAMIGSADCSHISVQGLGERFGPAGLFGKKVNIYADLPATPIKDPGRFKGLTGEDPMQVEKKGIDGFDLFNVAKMVFGTNIIPKLGKDVHDMGAFYDRWIILEYKRSFAGAEDKTIEPRIQCPQELSGILNWSLKGLKRLRSNGWKFSEVVASAKFYERTTEPLISFLEDDYEASEDEYIYKKALAKAASTYLFSSNLPPISSMKAFGEFMEEQLIIPVTTGRRGPKNSQDEAWIGIKRKVPKTNNQSTFIKEANRYAAKNQQAATSQQDQQAVTA